MKKIMDGKFEVKSEPVNLSEVFTKLRNLTKLQAQLKGLRFVVEYSGPEYTAVLTDERRILQLLLNLTANAIKYTHKGQISVKAKMSPKWVLDIQVKDTGIGIDTNVIGKIFDMFGLVDKKAEAKETGKYNAVLHVCVGVGIGLFFCKFVVAKLGGKINVKSALGRGTQFDVELPMTENRTDLTSCVSLDMVLLSTIFMSI